MSWATLAQWVTRNGAPFQYWDLPPAMERVRRRLKASDDDDRQMVLILTAVLSNGLEAVEAAYQQALAENVCSSAVILNCDTLLSGPDCRAPHGYAQPDQVARTRKLEGAEGELRDR